MSQKIKKCIYFLKQITKNSSPTKTVSHKKSKDFPDDLMISLQDVKTISTNKKSKKKYLVKITVILKKIVGKRANKMSILWHCYSLISIADQRLGTISLMFL